VNTLLEIAGGTDLISVLRVTPVPIKPIVGTAYPVTVWTNPKFSVEGTDESNAKVFVPPMYRG
jgi:hypothetical protein